MAWAANKWAQVIIKITLFKTVIPLTNYVNNKPILNSNQQCLLCYVVLSNVWDF